MLEISGETERWRGDVAARLHRLERDSDSELRWRAAHEEYARVAAQELRDLIHTATTEFRTGVAAARLDGVRYAIVGALAGGGLARIDSILKLLGFL